MEELREKVVVSKWGELVIPKECQFIKEIESCVDMSKNFSLYYWNVELISAKDGKIVFEVPFPCDLVGELSVRGCEKVSIKYVLKQQSHVEERSLSLKIPLDGESYCYVSERDVVYYWKPPLSGAIIAFYEPKGETLYYIESDWAEKSYIVRDGKFWFQKCFIDLEDIEIILEENNHRCKMLGIDRKKLPMFLLCWDIFDFEEIIGTWEHHTGKKIPIKKIGGFDKIIDEGLKLHPDGKSLVELCKKKYYGIYHTGKNVFMGMWNWQYETLKNVDSELGRRCVKVFKRYLGFLVPSGKKVYYKGPKELWFEGKMCEIYEPDEREINVPEGEYEVLFYR